MLYTERGDERPAIKLDKELFTLKADKMLPQHSLLGKFALETSRLILKLSTLLRIKEGSALFKEGDPTEGRLYIVLLGRFSLKGFFGKDDKFTTIGEVTAGDSLGEEGIFEMDNSRRKDTAYAETDSYVFELPKENWQQL